MPSVEDLKQALAEAEAAESRAQVRQHIVGNSVSQQAADPYAATSWAEPEYDFQTPSGQLCRLRKLDVTKLAEAGILDKITRLPGVVAETIRQSEGTPPVVEQMPSADTIGTLVEVVNILTPMVVVKPTICPLPPEGEERVPGRIYVDSIEIADRIAIMNRVLGALSKLDTFRQ